MMNDLRSARDVLSRLGDAESVPVLAAVSGGLDSMCLLHLLSVWGRERHLSVTAAHFNHGLRGETADRDEAFVREICEKWEIPCVCGRGDTRALVEKEGLSVEEAARVLRYAFLENQREALGGGVILTAHHANDNAETMLLNLLRGTGARGLTGIPSGREGILRPFLGVTRAELEEYAKKHNIPYVEDETNAELDAARNVLRHKVLPVLRELNPRAVENMMRTAELLTADDTALTNLAEQLLSAGAQFEEDTAELFADFCMGQERAVVSRALMLMMARVAGCRKDLSQLHVAAAMDLLYNGHAGQELSLPYGMTLRRKPDSVFLLRQEKGVQEPVPIVLGENVAFGDWEVTLGTDITPQSEYCYNVSLPKDACLSVSCWESRDRMHISGSRGGRTVKRLATDRGLTPTERDRLPVLRADGRPVAIPGIGIDVEFTPDSEKIAVRVTFLKHTEEKRHEK